ncbi:FAD-binding oxidoreductase [Arthrobacter sp. ISL-5]|uniref:NAD(P)/FAD-dependent oxidoreductase n=1 Tax=Arthrobacter sp. ISL-5 TaxID=2819111 RepID=UPI001BE6CD48|nr:FAD-dependent oxidoreductase [Arthrobacter sp. ISL-5]MBT2554157.1 FAD-binding oxidoreductase [Arthrobacter sp. ISL-5]
MNPVLDSADVVVIGAGIAGITTAFELRERGYDVVVVEQRFPAYGASGRSTGAVWLQTCQAGPELDLARAGRDKYQWYVDRLGNTFDYRQKGGLFFFETEAQGLILEDYVKDRSNAGLQVELLSAKDAKAQSSLLPQTAIGAVFCADDAQVDAPRFVNAVAGACARKGVRIYENTSVMSSIRQGDSVAGVRTTRGDILTPGIVWATGAWAVNLSTEGIDIPIATARQGQILTQTLPPVPAPIMRGPRGVTWASALTALQAYEESVFAPPQAGAQGGGSLQYDDTIAQNSEGGLFIGSSVDEPGALNPHIGMLATNAMLTAALDRYPEQAALGVVGLWAGITSWTEDHLPVIDRVDGLYLNVGHSRGITTGPIGGELMAAVVSGESPSLADTLSYRRLT